MSSLFAYSLASGLLLSLIYMVVHLTLSDETFHGLRRVMLMATLIISLTVPLVLHQTAGASLPVESVLKAMPDASSVQIDPAAVSAEEAATSAVDFTDFIKILVIIYLAGMGVSLLRFMVSFVNILHMIAKSEPKSNFGRWNVRTHRRDGLGAFGWGWFIVLPEHDVDQLPDSVLIHESSHLNHRHWLDLLMVELAGILLWYWLSWWALRRELAETHEFQADADVADSGVDIKEYQIMLLKKAGGSWFHSMASSLNQSNLLKRVKMMQRKKSKSAVQYRVALAIPAIALGLGLLCSPIAASVLKSVSDVQVAEGTSIEMPDSLSASQQDLVYDEMRLDSGVIFLDDRVITPAELDSVPAEKIFSFVVIKDDKAKAFLATRKEKGLENKKFVFIVTLKKDDMFHVIEK